MDNPVLLGVLSVAIVQMATVITLVINARAARLREAAVAATTAAALLAQQTRQDENALRDRRWAIEDRALIASTLAQKVDATAAHLAAKVSADSATVAADARAHATEIASTLSEAIAVVGDKAREAYTEANHVNHKIEKLGLALTPPAPGQATILVVDDDAILLRLAVRVLGGAGYLVRVAASAEAALQSLMTDGMPQLIVVDLRLPQMTGLAFTKQLRMAGVTLPIVAYSGGDTTEGRDAALAAGCTDYVAKTGEGAELLRRVAQWLAIAAGVAGTRH